MEELKAKFKKEFEEMKESLLDLEVDREEELKGREKDYQKRLDEFNERYSGEVFPTDIPKRDEEQIKLEKEKEEIEEDRKELETQKKEREFELQNLIRNWQKQIDVKRDELVKKAEKYEKPKEKLEEELKRQKEGLKVWEEKGIKDQLYYRRKDVVIPKIEKQIEELNKQIEDGGIKTEWVELGKIKSQLKDLPLHTTDSIMEELSDMSWFMEEPGPKRGSNVFNINDLINMSKGANPHLSEIQPEQEPEPIEPVDMGDLAAMFDAAYDPNPEPEEGHEVPLEAFLGMGPEYTSAGYEIDPNQEPGEEHEVPFAYSMGGATPEPEEVPKVTFEDLPPEAFLGMGPEYTSAGYEIDPNPESEEGHEVTEQDKILSQVREKIEMLIPEFDEHSVKLLGEILDYSLDAEGVSFDGKKYTFEELSEFEDKNKLEEKIKANLEPKDEKKLSENLDDYIFKAMAKQCEDTINDMIAKTESIIKDNPELKDEIGQMYKEAAKALIKDRYGEKIKALKEHIVYGGDKDIIYDNVQLTYDLRHMSVFSRMARTCTLEKAEINKLTETVYNLKDNEDVTIKVGPLTKMKFAIRDKLKGIKREKLTDGSENKKGIKAKVKGSYDKVVDRYTESRLYDGSKYPGGAKKAEAEVKGNKPDEFRKKLASGKRGTASSKLASKGSIKREQSGKGER